MGNQDLINPLLPREPGKPVQVGRRRVEQVIPQPGIPDDEHTPPSHDQLEQLEKKLASRDYFRRRRKRKQRRQQAINKRAISQLEEVAERDPDIEENDDDHLDLFV